MFRTKSRDEELETTRLLQVTKQLMQKDLESMTIDEARLMVKNGSTDHERLKGLRGLAIKATQGTDEQVHIASDGSLAEAVHCMKDNLGSAAIQRAGCVLIVNLARQMTAAGLDGDGMHPVPLTVAQHRVNLASHSGHHSTQLQQKTPWLRRTIIDAGGLDVILGLGEDVGCMGKQEAPHSLCILVRSIHRPIPMHQTF